MSRFYVLCALTESELGSFETLKLAGEFVSQLDFSEFKTETDIYIFDTKFNMEYIICSAGDDIVFVERYAEQPASYYYRHASDYDDGYEFF